MAVTDHTPADAPPSGRWYDVAQLSLHPQNARAHSRKNIEAIKASLARFGQQKPIVVGPDLVVVAGNGTLTAVRELGWRYVWGRETDLDAPDRAAYGLADNRTAELAEWDDDVLAEQLGGLREEGYDLDNLGFDEKDIERLLGGANFAPSDEEQPRLDELKPVVCPECGHEFRP